MRRQLHLRVESRADNPGVEPPITGVFASVAQSPRLLHLLSGEKSKDRETWDVVQTRESLR